MSAVAALPPLPLPETRATALLPLLEGLDASALWWLSGYAAALARGAAPAAGGAAAAPLAAAAPQARLTILYGSQTGNARRIAERLAGAAEAAGLVVRVLRSGAYPQRELRQERLLVVVISTHGDGDPPDDARGFLDFLGSKRAPRLPELHYAVLALGDSSYPQFCLTGRRVDARLRELGATALQALGEADLDIDTVATPWLGRTLDLAREHLKPTPPPVANVTPLRATAAPTPAAWTRERPFAAALLANQRIVGRDSTRDVRHIELSLEGAQLDYEPGDALGVWPTNPAWLVDALLATLKLHGAQTGNHDGRSQPLREWLTRERELTRLARPLVAAQAERARSAELARLLEADQREQLARLLASRQPLDLLRAWPATWSADDLVATLRPLAPRLYSIASSRKAVGEEVHLTVGVVDYTFDGERRVGAASQCLAQLGDTAPLPVYVEPNERFRLPADPARDIIMIGPGTGVAPFRAFVQERRETGASGRNWLVFGNRHFRSEFLYQSEWQEALRTGSLDRLDLAFSRDGAKCHVQDRLREHGRELHARLAGGAYLYVCGDASRMARDVHAALVEIVAAHGGVDSERAAGQLAELAESGRYVRDVY